MRALLSPEILQAGAVKGFILPCIISVQRGSLKFLGHLKDHFWAPNVIRTIQTGSYVYIYVVYEAKICSKK